MVLEALCDWFCLTHWLMVFSISELRLMETAADFA